MNLYASLGQGVALNVVLIAIDLWIILHYTLLAGRKLSRWVDFLSLLAPVVMIVHILQGLAMDPLMILLAIPLYLATLLLFIAAVPRLFRRHASGPAARWRVAKAVAALLCGVLVVLSAVRQTEMYAYTYTFAHRFVVLGQPPGGVDLSQQSWSQAFAGLISKLKTEYPFTQWKKLDWDALAAEFAPRIAAAEAKHDTKAYYRILREFAWRIPDAHVGLDGDDQGMAEAEVGGSFGLKLTQLDDGRLVVTGLRSDNQAQQSGLAIGAEIVAWNGAPLAEALAKTAVLWSEYPPATKEGRRLQQLRFLNRASVGATVQVTFRNRGETATHKATLTAIATPRAETSGPDIPDLIRPAVESRVLPSGYGYIRIKYELPTLLGFPETLVRQAVTRFAAANVPGIIVDVRNNFGGEEGMTAQILSPFYAQEQTMHYLGMFDPVAGHFHSYTSSRLAIKAAQAPYQGPVAVLVDHYSHSAAEDIAYFLQQLPNGMVVGMAGSAAGGGASSKDVQLPGGYTFSFPKAQQLDDNAAIEIESDASGQGGVTPDISVPLDDAAVDALAAGRDIVLEQAEIALQAQTVVAR